MKTDPLYAHLGGNVVGGDPYSLCPNMWEWVIKKYNVSSVLDVGCGEGEALEYFKKKNIRVFGVDGLKENIDKLKEKNIDCYQLDLTKEHYVSDKKFDIIWCCELVEHVEEKFINNILNTFLNGKVVLMTHALPRQRGYHHVNCKNDEYWIGVMENKGFEYLKEESIYSRLLAENTHWNKSGLIFQK